MDNTTFWRPPGFPGPHFEIPCTPDFKYKYIFLPKTTDQTVKEHSMFQCTKWANTCASMCSTKIWSNSPKIFSPQRRNEKIHAMNLLKLSIYLQQSLYKSLTEQAELLMSRAVAKLSPSHKHFYDFHSLCCCFWEIWNYILHASQHYKSVCLCTVDSNGPENASYIYVKTYSFGGIRGFRVYIKRWTVEAPLGGVYKNGKLFIKRV